MRTLRISCALLICLSLPLVVTAQSLGSVAKKERERRDKNKKEGVAAREITEEEVSTANEEEPAPESGSGEEPLAGEGGEENDPSEAPSEGAVIPGVKPTAPDDADPDKESRERKRSEAEWRSRAAAARARIDSARERVRYFEGLVLGPTEYYVDEQGHTVVESAEQLQSMTRAAKEELAAAESDWKRIQDEARRSGIPPGWIR
jgi:hypothetical protein